MAWKVPKIWDGDRCFILAGGPSVVDSFNIPKPLVQEVFKGLKTPSAYSEYMSSIHNEHVIGVNKSYEIGNWIDFTFYGDDSFGKKYYLDLYAHPSIKVCSTVHVKSSYGFKYLNREARRKPFRYGLTVNPCNVIWNLNSGGTAINLALHLGCKEIILLGFDMSLDQSGNQHWHKYYPKEKQLTIEGVYGPMRNCFQYIKRDADKLGLRIINCSMNSTIEEFEKIPLMDIL